jgi:carboxyl-terminal processing protease
MNILTRLRFANRTLGALLLAIVLAAGFIVWRSTSPDGAVGAVTRNQGLDLLDAIIRNVQSVYIDRTVNGDTLYQGAGKGALKAAGPACVKAVGAQTAQSDSGRKRFIELMDRIAERCGSSSDTDRLFFGAASGMLEALGDPYTRFMEPRAYREFKQDAQGFFFGIGIFIDLKDNNLIVVQPIPGTPAARAGLRAGDRIRQIDGASTDGMALQEAVFRIRGPRGTTVRLTIERAGRRSEVGIVRDRIEIRAAEGLDNLDAGAREELRESHIGYVRLVTFSDNSVRAFDRLVADVQRAGGRALVLDLRNNGGGLLDVSLEIANRFIPAGRPLVHTVNRTDRRQTERATARPKITIPVVVLVNEFSASASEILAGALQDSSAATLVGTKTFGKGVIQTVIELPLGSGAAITTAKYLTPNGRDIHKKGLSPDIVVGESEETLRQRLKGQPEEEIERRVNLMRAEQLAKAMSILKAKMRSATMRPAA